MFVPELVYLVALGQFLDARGVRDTINRKAKAFAREQSPTQDMHDRNRPTIFFWKKSLWAQEAQYIEMVHVDPMSYLMIITPFDKFIIGSASMPAL